MNRIVIERSTIVDPLGITMEWELETIEDCCPTCRGTGKTSFTTANDQATYDANVCECCGHCDCIGPEMSGRVTCETCKGSGHVEGAGPLHRMRCRPLFNLTELPSDLFT